MSNRLTELQESLVEEFGNIYEGYGLKRLKGLIVGLLLTQKEPVSLDDMAALLERSKGPISTAVRELSSIHLIRKVNGPENRRDYYAAHPDLFFNNFKFNMETVRRNRDTATRYLNQFGESDEVTRGKLAQMEAFYSLMEQFYESFSEAWLEQKAHGDITH